MVEIPPSSSYTALAIHSVDFLVLPMDPRFLAATKIGRHALRVLKSDVFDDQWVPNLWVIVVFMVLCIQLCECVIFLNDYSNKSTILLTENLGIMFAALQAIYCLLVIIMKRESWRSLLEKVEKRRYQYKSTNIVPIFDEFYQRTVLFSKIIYALYMACSSYYLLPIIAPDPDKLNLPIGLTLPYLDAEQTMGYCFTYIYQVLFVTAAQLALIGHICIVTVTVLSACCQIRCIKTLLRELSDLLNNPNSRPEAVRKLLGEIISLHVSSLAFIERLQNLLYLDYLTIFISCGIVIFGTLNVIANNVWTSATLFFCGGIGSILLQCLYGNMLLVENDTLADAFYGIDWYRLAVRERKAFQLALANAQIDVQLHGVFAPVNLATSVSIIRAAFSYFSILKSYSSD
ncbi:uncharacterized protein LOC129717355 [Wyeomyia smithii]|uniref:uncharacterized protein LOC129717355 n=1 Tax=Wyeomyia smithii TaxID=174621 RepID=UPI002467FEAB|nr:uncharacterized protein LOC129717355 [Wyeomyia smithii]